MRLEGKIAAITGGGSGIGRACALAFAREGADVAVGDLDPERAAQVAAEVRALGRRALDMRIDVTEQADLDRFVDGVVGDLGGLTVWVGSAGVSIGATLLDHTREDWRRVMDLNLDAVVFGSQAAARRWWSAAPAPSSISPPSTARALSASAWAIAPPRRRSSWPRRSWPLNLPPHGVRANSIGPGYTDTPLFRGAREEGDEAIAPLLDPRPGRTPRQRLTRSPPRPSSWPRTSRASSPATASSPTAAGWSTATGSAGPAAGRGVTLGPGVFIRVRGLNFDSEATSPAPWHSEPNSRHSEQSEESKGRRECTASLDSSLRSE